MQLNKAGLDMGGPMCFERRNLHYVVDALRTCLTLENDVPVTNAKRRQDYFAIYRRQDPLFFCLENHRLLATPHGGNCTLMMSKTLAEGLTDELTAIARQLGPAAGHHVYWAHGPPRLQQCSIEREDHAFLCIRAQQSHPVLNIDTFQTIWFERTNLRWVVERLQACLAASLFPDDRRANGQDRLEIYRAAVDEPFGLDESVVNLFNRRHEAVVYGGMHFVSLLPATAEKLVRDLASLL